MYLPREIVEKTLGEAGHPSRPRLLGRGWRDLRTREELEEELERPIDLEDILLWSRKTGKDFVIYGHGIPYYRQCINQEETIDPSAMADYYFHRGLFVLTGNAADGTFVELYQYVNDTRKKRYVIKEKKTTPLENIGEVFDKLFFPLEEIYDRELIGVEYEDGYTLDLKPNDPLLEEIIDYEYSEERIFLVSAWSEDKMIEVEGAAETLRGGVAFYGRSLYRKKLYTEREAIEYILRGRVIRAIPVEHALESYTLPDEERESFKSLLALRDDPRPKFFSEDGWK